MHIVSEFWISRKGVTLTIGRIGIFFIPRRNWLDIRRSPGSHLVIGPVLLGKVVKRLEPVEPFSWG